MLTADEIRLILAALRDKYGPCYSDDEVVSALHAKLAVLLEIVERQGR